MRIRIVKTGSGKHAVQVVSKHHGKLRIHKHLGSFVTDEERKDLEERARTFITIHTPEQQNLFSLHLPDPIIPGLRITNSQPLFLYRLLSSLYDTLGFSACPDSVIRDLVIARICQPVSKRETIEILADDFGKLYALKTIYRHLKQALAGGLKETFQTALVTFAKTALSDPLTLVFYDVTTLSFESTVKDDLRSFGFAKNRRNDLTQVVVGLVVTRQGFPLYFDVFAGNTFEGHTLETIIDGIKIFLSAPDLVVVADAAMLSQSNLDLLRKKRIGFVVGARLANLPITEITEISEILSGKDQAMTERLWYGTRLICQYSASRAVKDRQDRRKQTEKAHAAIKTPGTVLRHLKFISTKGQTVTLNTALLSKTEQLEGMKGYLTNTTLDPAVVIDRYHDLWRIEKAFRITKVDLEARPIFHRLDETIRAHLTIVVAGLAICTYAELKTGISTKAILKTARKVLTHTITIASTGERGIVESTIEDPKFCGQLSKLRNLGY